MAPSSVLDLPVWLAESNAILATRLAVGDSTTAAVGEQVLSSQRQRELAQRHPRQLASVIRNR